MDVHTFLISASAFALSFLLFASLPSAALALFATSAAAAFAAALAALAAFTAVLASYAFRSTLKRVLKALLCSTSVNARAIRESVTFLAFFSGSSAAAAAPLGVAAGDGAAPSGVCCVACKDHAAC